MRTIITRICSIIAGSPLVVLLVLSVGCGSNRAVHTSDSASAENTVSHSEIARVGVSPELAAMLNKGQQALDRSQWSAAEQTFENVLAAAPANTEARQGLAIARAYMDQGSTLDQVASEIRLRRESTLTEFDAAMLNAVRAIKEHEFTSARAMLLGAASKLQRNQRYLSVTERTSREKQAKRLLAEIDEWEELISAARGG